jgi:hypothetical protein
MLTEVMIEASLLPLVDSNIVTSDSQCVQDQTPIASINTDRVATFISSSHIVGNYEETSQSTAPTSAACLNTLWMLESILCCIMMSIMFSATLN